MATNTKSIKTLYKDEVAKTLAKEFEIKNVHAIPRISKIVINMGTGEKLRDKNSKEKLMKHLAIITGQKPKIQQARVSVAGFGLRAGMPVGLTVTLRGDRMYDFLQKLITIVLPRLRDFRGVPTTSFDGSGNYTLGISEYTVFPEIDITQIDRPHGMEITIVSNSGSKEKAFRMLELLGMPFQKTE